MFPVGFRGIVSQTLTPSLPALSHAVHWVYIHRRPCCREELDRLSLFYRVSCCRVWTWTFCTYTKMMGATFGSYIDRPGLEQLRKYKYVSVGSTPIDRLMNPFWNAVVTYIPMVSLLCVFSLFVFLHLCLCHSQSLAVSLSWSFSPQTCWLNLSPSHCLLPVALSPSDGSRQHCAREGTFSPATGWCGCWCCCCCCVFCCRA